MGTRKKATNQRTPCRKFLATPLLPWTLCMATPLVGAMESDGRIASLYNYRDQEAGTLVDG